VDHALTKRQNELLRYVAAHGTTTVFGSARVTAQALAKRGLVTFTNGGIVTVTDKGKSAL
jgi:hypothetical protein